MYEILVKLTCINRTPLYSEHTILTPWKLRTHNADPMEAQFRQVTLYF
jgi:hypothetical protein